MKSSSAKECQRTKYAAESNVQVAPAGIPAEVQDIPAQRTQDHEVVPGPTEMQGNPVEHTADPLGSHMVDCDLDDNHVKSVSSKNAVEHDHVHSALPEVSRGNTHTDTITNDGEPIGANNDGKVSRLTFYEDNCRQDIQISENHKESVEGLNDLQRAGNSVGSSASVDNTGLQRNNVSSQAHIDDNELKRNDLVYDVESNLIDGKLQDNMKNLSVPKSSCLYKCCSACFQSVYKMVHGILSNTPRPNLHCLTADDMHDILSSWCLNLLGSVRKLYSSHDEASCAENFVRMYNKETHLEHCACQSDIYLSRECLCHLESNGDAETANTDCHPLSGQSLSFFFKDGVWMPLNLTAETKLHCGFRRFCVCSLLGTVSMLS